MPHFQGHGRRPSTPRVRAPCAPTSAAQQQKAVEVATRLMPRTRRVEWAKTKTSARGSSSSRARIGSVARGGPRSRLRGHLCGAAHAPLGYFCDRCAAAACRRLDCRPRHSGAQHSRDASVPIFILRPPSIDASGLGIGDTLRLPPPAILVILARHSREHVQQHRIDGREHAAGEFIAWRRLLPARRQVKRNNSHSLGVDFRPKLEPVPLGQTRQTVHLLDQEHIAGFRVLEQSEKLRSRPQELTSEPLPRRWRD